MRKPNALAIGVCNLEYTNILLTYYPKGLEENFDIYLFVDDQKISIEDLKNVIAQHDIPVWNNAEYIVINDVYDYYQEKHKYEGKAKEFLYTHGSLFKILMPCYLGDKFGVKKTYTSEDDTFIFSDLSNMFEDYKEFAYKKNGLFYFKGSHRYKELASYNQVFESDFNMEELNALPVFSGNVVYSADDKLEYYFERYVKHPFVHHLFFDFKGYTSWTVEQRFQHFNIHRLLKEGRTVDMIAPKDLRIYSAVNKDEDSTAQYLKQVTPALVHYGIGAKKPIWLRDFIRGISWKFDGFMYEPKYELKDILYDRNWSPDQFKNIYDSDKRKKRKLL